MKKILKMFVLLCLLLGAKSAYAETRYGAIAGISFNDLKFSQDLITIDDKVGYSAGVFTEVMFQGIGFGLDLGCMYTQRGAVVHLEERKVWNSDGWGAERVYLHSLEIPLNLRFKFRRLGGFEEYCAPFLFAGPSFMINAGIGKVSAFNYAFGDIGLQFGCGLELFKKWQVSVSYNKGLTKCIETVKLDEFQAKNNSLNIRLAYFFK